MNSEAITTFAIKTAIVAVAIVASVWITLDHVNDMIEDRVYELTSTLGDKTKFRANVFWPRIEAGIIKAADPANELPPERQARLVAAVRVLHMRWKPVWDALVTDPPVHPPVAAAARHQ